MIRLFAALPLPHPIAQSLAPRQQGLPGARWRPAETLHVTLRFFGEVPENQADDLDLELSQIRSEAFGVELEGVGAFADGSAIHSVWAGIKPDKALDQLARRCESAARRAGLRADIRTFFPHVTLAYLRRPDPVRVAGWIQDNNLLRSPRFCVDSFGLYSSWRSSAGSRYQLERRYALAGRSP